MYHNLFNRLSTDGYLVCFQSFVTINNVTMNNLVYISLCLLCVDGSMSQGKLLSMNCSLKRHTYFFFNRKHKSVLQKWGCTNLHSYQRYMRVLVSSLLFSLAFKSICSSCSIMGFCLWTQWTWGWANSRRQWRTGKRGVLQSMGTQRVKYNLATEQHQSLAYVPIVLLGFCLMIA